MLDIKNSMMHRFANKNVELVLPKSLIECNKASFTKPIPSLYLKKIKSKSWPSSCGQILWKAFVSKLARGAHIAAVCRPDGKISKLGHLTKQKKNHVKVLKKEIQRCKERNSTGQKLVSLHSAAGKRQISVDSGTTSNSYHFPERVSMNAMIKKAEMNGWGATVAPNLEQLRKAILPQKNSPERKALACLQLFSMLSAIFMKIMFHCRLTLVLAGCSILLKI